MHVSLHPPPVDVGGGEGAGGGVVPGGGMVPGGAGERGPQSVQSVPTEQIENSAPAPPSSQSPSLEKKHVSAHVVCPGGGEKAGGEGGGGGGGGGGVPHNVQPE